MKANGTFKGIASREPDHDSDSILTENVQANSERMGQAGGRFGSTEESDDGAGTQSTPNQQLPIAPAITSRPNRHRQHSRSYNRPSQQRVILTRHQQQIQTLRQEINQFEERYLNKLIPHQPNSQLHALFLNMVAHQQLIKGNQFGNSPLDISQRLNHDIGSINHHIQSRQPISFQTISPLITASLILNYHNLQGTVLKEEKKLSIIYQKFAAYCIYLMLLSIGHHLGFSKLSKSTPFTRLNLENKVKAAMRRIMYFGEIVSENEALFYLHIIPTSYQRNNIFIDWVKEQRYSVID